MQTYKNVMESVVENKYDEIKNSLNCCKCERCRADVIAYALNRLPPKYVVSHEGELYTKINLVGEKYRVPILSALAEGARIVGAKPSHGPVAEQDPQGSPKDGAPVPEAGTNAAENAENTGA